MTSTGRPAEVICRYNTCFGYWGISSSVGGTASASLPHHHHYQGTEFGANHLQQQPLSKIAIHKAVYYSLHPSASINVTPLLLGTKEKDVVGDREYQLSRDLKFMCRR